MLFPKKQGKENQGSGPCRDVFQTLETFSRLFPDSRGIRGRRPRDTFFRLFWGFGPKGPRDPCKWSTGPQIYSTLSALEVYNNQSPTLPYLARHQQMAFSVHTPKLDARRPSSDIRRRIEWAQPHTHTQGSHMPSFHSTWRGAPTQIRDYAMCADNRFKYDKREPINGQSLCETSVFIPTEHFQEETKHRRETAR